MKTKAVFATLILALAGAAVAAPAYAAPVLERNDYSGTDEFTECDGRYNVVSVFSGTSTIRESNDKFDGQYFPFSNRYRFEDTLTNIVTGDYVTVSGSGKVKEIKAVNLGGGIFEYVLNDTGHVKFKNSSGTVILRESGLVAFTHVFDTLSDSQPGGELLSETFLRESGHHPTAEDEFDFCAFIDSATS